jgi:hypothetical protein
VAALIEAFWSPHRFDSTLKFTVALLLWLSVLAYLMFAGRSES